MDKSITYAKKYLEDLLSFFGLNIDVTASSEQDVIELSIPSSHLNGFLIGHDGETMRSMQFLVSSALKNGEYEFYRVSVDVADYKKQRGNRISEEAIEWIKQVKESGEPLHLKPMNAADRRIVHKTAQDNGVVSESEGDARDRHIVLKPAEKPTE
jgi:spoIIIJ-associated protein